MKIQKDAAGYTGHEIECPSPGHDMTEEQYWELISQRIKEEKVPKDVW